MLPLGLDKRKLINWVVFYALNFTDIKNAADYIRRNISPAFWDKCIVVLDENRIGKYNLEDYSTGDISIKGVDVFYMRGNKQSNERYIKLICRKIFLRSNICNYFWAVPNHISEKLNLN